MTAKMKRREFITLLGGTAAAWPLTARAQQPAMPMVGFMNVNTSAESASDLVAAFRQGLKEIGFVEGQNVAVEYRWAEGQYDRFPELAAEFVRRQVAVIAATGGLVTNLRQPGGNVTGITIFGPAAVTKRVQLMHQLIPQATTTLIHESKPSERRNRNEGRTDGCRFSREGNSCR
jgi:putative ABC transport system substrate-binding protein